MKNLFLIACLLASLVAPSPCTSAPDNDAYVLSGPSCKVAFSRSNGSIISLDDLDTESPILRNGQTGLWQLQFRDGTILNAADFDEDSSEREFSANLTNPDTLRMEFKSAVADVDVTAKRAKCGIEFTAQVTSKEKTALEFVVPGQLRFDPDTVRQFICPTNSNVSVGVSFNARFFGRWPDDPAGWSPESIGTAGYRAVYGSPLNQRPVEDPPVELKITEDGQEWLGHSAAKKLNGRKATVNRAPTPEQIELNLVDTAHGPFLSACSLGGDGYIWRIGAMMRRDPQESVLTAISPVLRRLVSDSRDGRTKLGLIALKRGPQHGSWTDTSVDTWRRRLQKIAGTNPAVEFVEIKTARGMLDAARSDGFVAILNPYGEWLPVPHGAEITEVARDIKEYAKSGGNWFEVGGYSFFQALRPDQFLDHSVKYPSAFADFMHLDSTAGLVSIYGVQPHTWEAWRETDSLFVPGRLSCGGDEEGGYCQRAFATYVPPGQKWNAPPVRLDVGRAAPESLRTYCEANHINRGLEDKMSLELLKTFRDALMVKYNGNCSQMLENIDKLPTPSIVHITDYLRVGFDEPYPDHLPPRPEFGTPDQLRKLVDRCHELGHLFMPYVNPTWWCDNPKSPTFEREGTDPLLKTLDGGLSRELYGGVHDGYTVCHWHPAVQAANRETVKNFTEKYPSDILLQDQCGARQWRYDTNPASPTPYAYSHGMMSMVAEDSQRVPLSTESGWDGVVNYESQLCGMSWGIVPYPWSRRPLLKTTFPPESWRIYPIAQYIAHDKCAMLHHDLGQFVHDRRRLAWTLGLGFCLSYRTHARRLTQPETWEWPKWLSRLQKSLCARYLGEPVKRFEHRWGQDPTQGDDGVIEARYGKVSIIANLNPYATQVEGTELPKHGFIARAPGLIAGDIAAGESESVVSFVTEWRETSGDIWIFARPYLQVSVPLPTELTGPLSVAFDSAGTRDIISQEGRLSLRLPDPNDSSELPAHTRCLWHANVKKVVE